MMKTRLLFFSLIIILSACVEEAAPQRPRPTNDRVQDCLEDAMHDVPEEFSRCNNDPSPPIENVGANTGCPNGCISHIDGCDIKGNISFDSGEKIYHVPGQEFYSDTNIDPDFDERWFCTEADAIANGWRKSNR